jgi:carnitine O-palmitoyltransferase 2
MPLVIFNNYYLFLNFNHYSLPIQTNILINNLKELDREVRELDKADTHGNYISEPWFDMYLSDRSSIVLNYNPFITFAKDPNSEQRDQAIRATNFLISSLRFLKSFRANKLKPEIFHINPAKSDTVFFQRFVSMLPEAVSFYGAYFFNAYSLDMSQYHSLFNSTRIPRFVFLFLSNQILKFC